jgi:hypothetical protein
MFTMPKFNLLLFVGLLVALSNGIGVKAAVPPLIIDPSEDGAIFYRSDGTIGLHLGGNMSVHYSSDGALKFPIYEINRPFTQAILAVRPVGFPVDNSTLNVIGVPSQYGNLGADLIQSNNVLGTWTLFDYQDPQIASGFLYDVTEFVRGANTPYVGFRLELLSGNGPTLSTRFHYATPPSQLIVFVVPEPDSALLILCGGCGLFVLLKKRKAVMPRRGRG